MHRASTVLLVALGLAALAAAGCSSSDASDASDARRDSGPTETSGGERVTDPASVSADPSAGCGAGQPLSPGESRVDTAAGGGGRWYLRHVPPGHDGATPVPVVLDLHGYSEGATVHALHTGLGPFGDRAGFVTLTPHGRGPVPRWDTALGSPDVEFIGALLDEAEAQLCVDRNRVYVTGLSNGAFMTSTIACAYPERIAAAAPVAGIRDIDGCVPDRPVPVVAFHGTADDYVRYDGGMGAAVGTLPAPDGSGRTLAEVGKRRWLVSTGPTTPEITAAWAQRNGCAPTTTETPVAGDVSVIAWDCPAGAEAELYRVDGGGHSWPGSEFSRSLVQVAGPTTMSISANEIMWDFFDAHPRRAGD